VLVLVLGQVERALRALRLQVFICPSIAKCQATNTPV
jgi:hypothetical protein